MVSTRQMASTSAGVSDNGEYATARMARSDCEISQPPGYSTYLRVTRQNSHHLFQEKGNGKNLLDLPDEVITMCLSYLSFKNVCQSRLVRAEGFARRTFCVDVFCRCANSST